MVIESESPLDPVSRVSSVPASLRGLNQWICWDLVEGRKHPRTVDGETANICDPSTFSDFETAVKASSKFTGLAFVIQRNDGLVGIDLNNCYDQDLVLREWAVPFVLQFLAVGYGELSPSGRGIKFLTRARKPFGCRFVRQILAPDGCPFGDGQQIVCKGAASFWAISGNNVPHAIDPRNGQAEIEWLCRNFLQDSQTESHTREVAGNSRSVVGDQTLRKRARHHLTTVSPPSDETRTKSISSLAVYLARLVNDQSQSMDAVDIVDLMLDWGRSIGLNDGEVTNTTMSALTKDLHRPALAHPLKHNSKANVFVEKSFCGVPADEVWDQPLGEIDWLIEDVFSSDQPTIFGAKQKTLKTTVLIDLAVALATETPWLSQFRPPRKLRVLLLTGESSQRAVSKRIRKATEFRGMSPHAIGDRIRIEATHFPSLSEFEDCQAIRKAVKDHGIDVVILDPLYMGLGVCLRTVERGVLHEGCRHRRAVMTFVYATPALKALSRL